MAMTNNVNNKKKKKYLFTTGGEQIGTALVLVHPPIRSVFTPHRYLSLNTSSSYSHSRAHHQILLQFI
jgi:hypothetical protein